MNNVRIIRWPELHKMLKASRSTIDRWENNGKFPKKVHIGENSIGWKSDEVEEFINNRKKGKKSFESIPVELQEHLLKLKETPETLDKFMEIAKGMSEGRLIIEDVKFKNGDIGHALVEVK